jgi:signal transduction histidine kinase
MVEATNGRILVVDDEAAQMKALCNTLRDQGYLTSGFTSARDALAALQGQRFDLVLTDLKMPEMDGLTLLCAAYEMDEHLVGIVMTGHGTIDSAVDAMKAGALDYILKPFKLSVILPVLSRALAVRQLRIDNAALTVRLHARTAELEAVNRELEAFSHSVAHDLRAPLRSIDGFGSILLEDHAPEMGPEAQELLQTVTASARQMGQLIDALLRFSQMGRQALVMKPVQVDDLVRQVLEELRAGQPDGAVTVVVGDLPDAVGDESLLKQVFVNLLSNAFKFTRRRESPAIEVGCETAGGELVYFVRDNGAGFDMQLVQRLFGVFQRMHRAEDFEGTGIGLSIVQRIIHRHGGRIWADAAVDQGATFFFTLPAVANESANGSETPFLGQFPKT